MTPKIRAAPAGLGVGAAAASSRLSPPALRRSPVAELDARATSRRRNSVGKSLERRSNSHRPSTAVSLVVGQNLSGPTSLMRYDS